jgi:hypothetical protein
MGVLVEKAKGQSERSICGLPAATVISRLVARREPLLALLRELEHPHRQAYREATIEVLEAQVWSAACHWSSTYPVNQKPAPLDVVLMAIAKASDLDDETKRRLLGGVPLEADLAAPVMKKLEQDGYVVKAEVPIGDSRADLVGFKRSAFWSERLVTSVELKNAASEVERLLGQVQDYQPASDEVWVVLTPQCLLEVTLSHFSIIETIAFTEKLRKWGVFLFVYDATSQEFHRLLEGEVRQDGGKFNALWDYLNRPVEGAAA